MKKTISRVWFCETCEKRGRPYDGMKFLVFGTTHNRGHYHWYSAPTHSELARGERYLTPLGYVPHIFTVDKVLENGNFFVIYSCGCDGCGVTFKELSDGRYKAEIEVTKTMEMTPKQWHDLCNFTNTGYEI